MFALPLSRFQPQALAAVLLSLSAVACGPPDEGSRLGNKGPIPGAFYVSDYFTPSGDMGDGEFAGNLITTFNENCKERPAGAGGDCYRFDYHPSTRLWAGVYWVFPSNSWGAYPGRSVTGPVDLGNGLRGYNSVTFQAATDQATLDANPNGFYVNFIAGGISGEAAVPPLPYSDQTCDATGTCTPFKASYGDTLTTDWKTLTIDLSSTPLTSVIGAFCWVSNYPNGTDPTTAKPQTIFIDNIIWE